MDKRKSTAARPRRLSMSRLQLGKLFLPFAGEFFPCLITDLSYGREALTPLIRPHRFNDHAGVMPLLARLNDRIERSAPGAAQNVHRGGRNRAGGYSPNHLVETG